MGGSAGLEVQEPEVNVLDPDVVLSALSNANLYFMLYVFFDLTVVVSASAQMWSLTSDRDLAMFIRSGAFGEHPDISVAKMIVAVIISCFSLDILVGLALVAAIRAFDEETVMSSTGASSWNQVRRLTNINFYCNAASLVIWFIARLTQLGMNFSSSGLAALCCVLIIRIVKMRPMLAFKACTDGMRDTRDHQFGHQAFAQLHHHFGSNEDEHQAFMWKCAAVSCACLVFVMFCLTMVTLYLGYQEANMSNNESFEVAEVMANTPVPGMPQPLANTPAPGMSQPGASGSQTQMQGVVQPAPAPLRRLKHFDGSVTSGRHVWYCHETSLFHGDHPCSRYEVAKHYIEHRATDALASGTKNGAMAGVGCVGVSLGLDASFAGLPAGLAVGAGCAIVGALGGFSGTYMAELKDDDCISECSDEIDWEAKHKLWCIPYERHDMRPCSECSWCYGCDEGYSLGWDDDSEQC